MLRQPLNDITELEENSRNYSINCVKTILRGNENIWQSAQTTALTGNISRKLSKNILPQKTILQVYKTHLESHLHYDYIFSSILSNTYLAQLQRLHTRTNKVIENARDKDRQTCKWSTVKSSFFIYYGVMTFRFLIIYLFKTQALLGQHEVF